ncbi:MAG: aminotransferase class I/II-fold pyridoxal phosphate-dependent enzyme [Alphaproteobacteria bacterium]|nr:aminotransferase class I/II-fold pyridoxal phosphate-dependent enzyme [Alphaproteobacteria bacterium]
MVTLNCTSQKLKLSPTLAANEAVSRLREQGQTILHMGFGQAPFPVPVRLKEALIKHASNNKYLPSIGLSELCEAVLSYYSDIIDVDPSTHDVIIAPGSKLILYAAQLAVKGDLLMPVPSWVSYEPQAKMLGTEVIKVSTQLDDEGYHINAEALRNTIIRAREEGKNPTKIILNYPNNPTGLTISEPELAAIAQVCIDEDIFIISDEIYGLVSYDGIYRSISKYAPDHTIVSTGLSKHMALGGWRVGLAIIPKSIEGLKDLMVCIASETWSCVPSPVQYAVLEAYKGHEDIENYVSDCCAIYDFVNTYIAKGLRDIGLTCSLPQGAFYLYPDFKDFRDVLLRKGVRTSEELEKYLLETHGLVTLNGTGFGEEPETLTLRLSGCDYDGDEVLNAYQNGEPLNADFIARHAPNINLSLEAFAACVDRQSANDDEAVVEEPASQLA